MKKIITVIGARPQIIKAAALSRAIENNFKDQIKEILVHTGQHYDQNMSQVFFDELGIPKPDYQLSVGSSSHGEQTGKMLIELEKILLDEKADALVVYGDTNSTIAGSLAAVKLHIPVVHIEAGLRSFNKKMPEEINRIATDHFSTLLFSPTKAGVDNLKNEGFKDDTSGEPALNSPKVFHCGDVMYDNSIFFAEKASKESNVLNDLSLAGVKYVLSTIHRPSNTDSKENLTAIFKAFMRIARQDNVVFVLPLHPRTVKKADELLDTDFFNEVKKSGLVKIVPPVSFLDIIQLEQNAHKIVTDSGGLQKEAYFFKKKCVILRNETEWVEILEEKGALTAGSDEEKIVDSYFKLDEMNCDFPSIFGDGKAGDFICEKILSL